MTPDRHMSRNTADDPPLRRSWLRSLFRSVPAAIVATGPRRDIAASKVTTIGVNCYLWRASLDTLSFMPLLQTDSNGGVIVTDWYVNPAAPTERMKVTVTILDQDLRADALRVAALRQVNQGGQWVAAPVQAATCRSSRTSSSRARAICAAPRSPAEDAYSWRPASMR